LSRSEVVFGATDLNPEGFIYVSFGNARDIQPWHGWVFELDVESWRTSGAPSAVTSVLLTTPETDCPVEGQSGSRDMICGGGVWAPSGPVIYPYDGTFELIVPTGNGELNFNRKDYANTLMRTGPGLAFEDGCDALLCDDFDTSAPAEDCVESCANVFVPRLLPSDPPLQPQSGACDDLTFFECYAALDYDLGANSPTRVETSAGPMYVLPAKDGSVYLVDGVHLGTMHDRLTIIEQCGTTTQGCLADWAGMMVTQPEITHIDGTPVAIIPTFIRDLAHEAGIVAVGIHAENGEATLSEMWRFPAAGSAEAVSRFRLWPGRPVLTTVGGEVIAWVVEVRGPPGVLHGIAVSDGTVRFQVTLNGKGRRFVQPLVVEQTLFLPSCNSNSGPGVLEAYALQ
jgi:hypothetical protein